MNALKDALPRLFMVKARLGKKAIILVKELQTLCFFFFVLFSRIVMIHTWELKLDPLGLGNFCQRRHGSDSKLLIHFLPLLLVGFF